MPSLQASMRQARLQAWADYLDSLRARTEVNASHQAGEQAASTVMDAFQHADSERTLSFQAQAMEALHAIMLLSKGR
jgi:hypothetical protein